MSIYLTHREALRRTRLAGCLWALLRGAPELVIGIRRSGVPVAIAFADGAGAARTVFVTRHAATRPEALGVLTRWGRRLVPPRLRQIGRSLLYRPLMRLAIDRSRAPAEPVPFIDEHAELRAWLATGTPQSVVIVDDAVDTGVTMRGLIDTVRTLDPRHAVAPFAVTSTLGVEVHTAQHHLFEDVLEYLEGDLGRLDETGAAKIIADLAPLNRSAAAAGRTRLEVDLHDLLVCPPEVCVARALIRTLHAYRRRATALHLRARVALWRLGHLPDGGAIDVLQQGYDALPRSAHATYVDLLAAGFRDAIQPLLQDPNALRRLDLHVRVCAPRLMAVAATRAFSGAAVVEDAPTPPAPTY